MTNDPSWGPGPSGPSRNRNPFRHLDKKTEFKVRSRILVGEVMVFAAERLAGAGLSVMGLTEGEIAKIKRGADPNDVVDWERFK